MTIINFQKTEQEKSGLYSHMEFFSTINDTKVKSIFFPRKEDKSRFFFELNEKKLTYFRNFINFKKS